MGKPTQPNRTHKSTASDSVNTPHEIASMIVKYFNPSGLILEPCRGYGNIYNVLPEPKDWCEIKQGRDFLEYRGKVDWIITNPPYSIYDIFLQKCFEVADNVVLLTPIAKAFKSMKIERLVDAYGGLKLIWLIGSGTKCGFAFGFPTGCLYYQRGYKGKIERVSPVECPVCRGHARPNKVTYTVEFGYCVDGHSCPNCDNTGYITAPVSQPAPGVKE